jgi:hypothetical protein
MATASPDEVEEEHSRVLGPELGPVYHALYNDTAWLHVQWREFRKLFGASEARIDLLNVTAPVTFRVVQDSLWEGCLMGLCRLTDPTEPAGKSALTIRRLPALVPLGTFRTELQARVDHAVNATGFARDWRNRQIAHSDLALALDQAAQPLSHASRELVTQALAAIAAVFNAISTHYFHSDLEMEPFLGHGGADELFAVLQEGARAQQARLDRFAAGRPIAEDLNPPPAV